jgi:hypothetical protein
LPLRHAIFAAALLAALVVPALATGAPVTKTKIVNLDGDPELEQVIPQEVCTTFAGAASASAFASACEPDQLAQRRVVVEDTCNGAPYTRAISSEQEAVIKLVVSNFEDITPRPEIFFDLRSGAGGRFGEIRIVSWEDGPTPGVCPEPRALFRYPSKRTRGRVPRRAKSGDTFDATLRDVSKHYAGKELRLRETYVDRNDALCCPSFERITWFGYSAGKDLYVRFRTHVKRIRK